MEFILYWLSIICGFFLTCTVHELGHAVLARVFGVPIKDWGWTQPLKGPWIKRSPHPTVWKDKLISAGGILANLGLALIAWYAKEKLLMGFNLVLAGTNMLPIKGSDGERILNGHRDGTTKIPVSQEGD